MTTRQGLTFDDVMVVTLVSPGFVEHALRLTPVFFLPPPRSPIEAAIDAAALSKEEREKNRRVVEAIVRAAVFLLVWIRLPMNDGENCFAHDRKLAAELRELVPEMFETIDFDTTESETK